MDINNSQNNNPPNNIASSSKNPNDSKKLFLMLSPFWQSAIYFLIIFFVTYGIEWFNHVNGPQAGTKFYFIGGPGLGSPGIFVILLFFLVLVPIIVFGRRIILSIARKPWPLEKKLKINLSTAKHFSSLGISFVLYIFFFGIFVRILLNFQ